MSLPADKIYDKHNFRRFLTKRSSCDRSTIRIIGISILPAISTKEHPLAELLPVELFPEYEIDSQIVWSYRKIISILPYLLKNHFSRERRIVPVNNSLNNMVCTNTSEAYGLLLTGIGYSFVPGHLLMQHPDLLFCRWKESPKAPFSVYYRKNADADKSSEIHAFLETAQSVYSREQRAWRTSWLVHFN